MDIGVIILLVVVILHFVVGFGYLVYKLSPKKETAKDEKESTNVIKKG